jgi:hypothetical protein
MTTMKRWRGLAKLLVDAVEHGSAAVERVQLETVRRPFVILEKIPPIAESARSVHVAHDLAVSSVYAMIRAVNGVAGKTIDVALDVVEAMTDDDHTLRERAREDSLPERNARRDPEENTSAIACAGEPDEPDQA